MKLAIILMGIGQILWGQAGLRLRGCGDRPCAARDSLRAADLAPRQHYLVQFRQYPSAGVRAELSRRGVRVLGYVPDTGLMVSLDRKSALDGADVARIGLVWIGRLTTAQKTGGRTMREGAWLAVFHADVPPARQTALAESLGLEIVRNPYLLPNQLVVMGSATGIEALAASDEVAYLVPASPDLLNGTPVMGCPGPMAEAGQIADYAQAGPGWSRDSSGAVSLQYVFQALTPKAPQSSVESEIERAFREWQKYGKFTLTQATQANAARTIAILFGSRAHGDAYPFDGPGGVLAHTFYPPPNNAEPIAGDMHFDADEPWNIGSYVDVFSVALHEAGHALGLGHSSVPGSVMYPYYQFSTGLKADDIAGIQAIYGAAGSSSSIPPVTGANPVVPPVTPPVTPPVAPGTPPSIAILSPNGTILSTQAASLHVTGTAGSGAGIASVKWSTSNGDAGIAAGTTSWSADVPLLVGNTVITVRAYDTAGNSAWRAITVVRH